MDYVYTALLLAIAYVLGSIPTGLLVGKGFYNVDLRTKGSKNIGATNAYRILGKKAALLVFAGDFLKGFVAVLLFMGTPNLMLLGGLLAILGHSKSIFLGFNGGKGVATGLGVIFAIAPIVATIALVIWMLIVFATRYVSLASIIAAISVPISMICLDTPLVYIAFGIVTALFVIYRHHENISRLLKGEESKIGKN